MELGDNYDITLLSEMSSNVLHRLKYRPGTINSNTVNSKFSFNPRLLFFLKESGFIREHGLIQ